MKTFCCISWAQRFFGFQPLSGNQLLQWLLFWHLCRSRETPTLDLFFLINDMTFDAFKNTLERQHVIIGDPKIISFDRCQEVEFRSFGQFLFDLAGGKSLIGNDDPFRISLSRINAEYELASMLLPGKTSAHTRFHRVRYISIQYGYFTAASGSGLVRICRKIIHDTGILF